MSYISLVRYLITSYPAAVQCRLGTGDIYTEATLLQTPSNDRSLLEAHAGHTAAWFVLSVLLRYPVDQLTQSQPY